MIAQEPVKDEVKPEEPPPSDDPPPSISTGIVGNGPADGFGLSGGRGGNGRGGNGFRGGNGGGRFDRYAAQVQTRLEAALLGNRKTSRASGQTEFRIWADDSGRITRVKLNRPTGNAAVDSAIENEVLPGLHLDEPMPPGMPSPIVLRMTARRPN